MQRRRAIWLGGLALVAAFALIASACGGSNNESSGATTTQSTTSSSSKTFANFRIAYDTGLDYMDPGLSYTVEGWEIMWNEYIPLLTYKHVNGPDGAILSRSGQFAGPQQTTDNCADDQEQHNPGYPMPKLHGS